MATTEALARVVVCDAGPVIHLDEVGCLALLSDFSRVLLPVSVWEEVSRHRPTALANTRVPLERSAASTPLAADLAGLGRLFGLHRVELQALHLALECTADLFLTDDTAARLAARQLLMPVHGTIGIVVRAVRRGQKTKDEDRIASCFCWSLLEVVGEQLESVAGKALHLPLAVDTLDAGSCGLVDNVCFDDNSILNIDGKEVMMPRQTCSRRHFLGLCASSSIGALVAPTIIPSGVLAAAGQPGANERIGIGYVGAGRRANQLMNLPPEGRIVAAADWDRTRAEAVATKRNCRAYHDYRELLDAKDVDAVFVAVPDHWHVLASIHACQAGKDIYLEKPLSLTIREGRVLVNTVRKYGRILQTGTQRRSMSGHRRGCELVRNGLAGSIHTVEILNYPSPWECQFSGQEVPSGLNWDAWCGMTEPIPYHADIFIQRSNPGWISLRPYSGGEMTGTGAHGFDQIQWALNLDYTGPVEIWCEGGKLEPVVYKKPESRSRGNSLCSRGRRVRMRYSNGITIRLENNGPASGGVFIGDAGKIRIGNNVVTSNPAELAQTPVDTLKWRLPETGSHIQNWFDCIKSREKPIADVEIGHRSTILCHLGNIARWVGRKLTWDPVREVFPGDNEANSFLDRPRRKGYELPG